MKQVLYENMLYSQAFKKINTNFYFKNLGKLLEFQEIFKIFNVKT